MDVRYFLGKRLSFINKLYTISSAPFIEQKRKIENGEEPFISPYSEDTEPAFLSEWLEAEESLQVIGTTCISMLSTSLHLYFKTWERQLGIPVDDSYKSDFKRGWFNGYKAYFNRQFNIIFENSPCNLKLLEELVLARNCVQHPKSIIIQDSRYSAVDLKKLPNPLFINDYDRELLSEIEKEEGGRSWLLLASIHITQEKLTAAISEVARFAEWLEQTDH